MITHQARTIGGVSVQAVGDNFYVRRDGTLPLTAAWGVGGFDITGLADLIPDGDGTRTFGSAGASWDTVWSQTLRPSSSQLEILDQNAVRAMIINASGIIVAQDGQDRDFRIEGGMDANLFVTDGGTDRVGIGTITPDAKLHVVGDIHGTEDIYNVGWTDYGATSVISGFAPAPTVNIWYKKVGNLVFLNFVIEGTSNAVSFAFTLPYTLVNDTNFTVRAACRTVDNGVVSVEGGYVEIGPNSATATVYFQWNGTLWTAAGAKQAGGQFWFEAQ